MDKERMVNKAVELAKNQGVSFESETPMFRPKNGPKERFRIVIKTNTSRNSAGHVAIDEHFDVLDNFNEKSLSNYLIKIFNALNIESKAKEID
ncbi:hypothetical protein SC123_10030 [Legionella pneumophila serogroup 1]|uniref:hypothetical protein n=1 Tax=Legionella pneumophila TaxID=446 RepID=UPI00197FFC68|nr:hypothetical protein [Legionella pneumophila]MBN5929497.1 hypothetical protein [Legionella pneumophila]